jgi:hypothetical protein
MAELELTAQCKNVGCLRVFHLVPANLEQVELYNEILVFSHARGPVWLSLRCPVCGHIFQQLGSILIQCDCGIPVHVRETSELVLLASA